MSRNLLILCMFCASILHGKNIVIAQNTASIKLEKNMKQPPFLKPGDTVAIVAPAGILKNKTHEINQAQKLLKGWGLNVVIGKHIFNQNNHFSGTDEERYEDFQDALNDPNIKAIWCARGGYGSVRIIDKLDWSGFIQNPKWIIGYSDITAFHNHIHNLGFESMHAMMCTSLQDAPNSIKNTIESFKAALFGIPLHYTLEGSNYNKEGSVLAPIVGGNLTILQTMLGSKTSIDTSGKILFIEEIGEYKYHIDRMLQSLKRAGYFENCKGVIVGNMSKLKSNTTKWGSSIEQLVLDALSDYNFPIAFNMPAGHEKDNRALIFGKTVELIVKKEQSTIIFKGL